MAYYITFNKGDKNPFKRVIKVTLRKSGAANFAPRFSSDTIDNDAFVVSAYSTPLELDNPYVKLLDGKYKNSIGKIQTIIGTRGSYYTSYSYRIVFADKKYAIVDGDIVEYHQPPEEFSDRLDFKKRVLPELTLSNELKHDVEKGKFCIIYSAAASSQVYAFITSVTKDEDKSYVIKYKTSDRRERFCMSAESVYVFPDQETAKKLYAIDTLTRK